MNTKDQDYIQLRKDEIAHKKDLVNYYCGQQNKYADDKGIYYLWEINRLKGEIIKLTNIIEGNE